MRLKLVYAAMAALPVSLLAFSTGPPIKRTGQIDGGNTCVGCHTTFAPANSDPAGSVRVASSSTYSPGIAQTIKVTVSHPLASRWGFQLTARFLNGGGMAGTLLPGDDGETKVVCDDGTAGRGTAGPCAGGTLAWIEHLSAPRSAPGEGHTFTFQWMPPAEENGDVIFYFAGNAANGDGNLTGDRIYTSTTRLSLSPTSSCSISKKPTVRTAVNAAPHAGPISGNSLIEIYGSDFQSGSRKRTAGLGDLGSGPVLAFPKELSCVAVEIDGQRAPVFYTQQDQINAQVPTSSSTGPVRLVVIANPGRPNELRSDVATITQQAYTPGLFTVDGKTVAALFAGKADVVSSATPAKPGDIVSLFGTGFGFTNPTWQAGEVSTGLSPLVATPTITIGGVTLAPADIQFAGLAPQSISGLYQFNLRIPASVPDGDQPVIITVGGVSSDRAATVPVKR